MEEQAGEAGADRSPGEGDERLGVARPAASGGEGELAPLLQRGRPLPHRLCRVRRPGTLIGDVANTVAIIFFVTTTPPLSLSSFQLTVVISNRDNLPWRKKRRRTRRTIPLFGPVDRLVPIICHGFC